MRPCLMLSVLSISLVCGHPAFGQAVNGSLVGTITDSSGGVIANAPISAMERNTGIGRNATTNESGNYTFADLTPGTYRVSAEQPGFRKAVKDNVIVLVNTTVRADLQLQPGQITETVEVSADAAILQTDRSDTGRKIETKQVEDLPLGSNRNFQSLLNLVPGTTRARRLHSEFFNAQDSLSTEVNGVSSKMNSVQLEGIDDNERTGLLQVIIPPNEAIQTVDVSTSNYEAELGRAGGAVTNVVLKSGGNRIHGAAYEFNRVSALSSRGFFDAEKAHSTYNYVGGNIGGPIIKNRTFFFGDYLKILDHRANTNNFQIPSDPFRGGDFSSAATVVYDPATGNPDGTNRQPFPGNVIPASRINPLSAKILGLVPHPNQAGLNNFFALTPFSKDSDSFDIKVDHNQTSSDRFTARYSFQRPAVFDGAAFGPEAGGPRGGGFAGLGIQKMQSSAVNYDRIFGPSLIMEARAGVNRYRNDARQTDYGEKASDALGVPGVNIDGFTSGLVGVNVNGGYSTPLIGFSPSLPWVRAETNFIFVNTWTKTLGNHTVKWGMDLRRLRDDLEQTQTFSPRGLYQFREGQTGLNCTTANPCPTGQPKTGIANDMASFLLDLPDQAGRDILFNVPAYREWQFFLFAQDKWQLSPKLTVDLGLRWEFYPPGTPHHTGGFSNFDPATNSLVVAGIGGNPLDLGLDKHYKDFAPRLGFAYRLNQKTVARSGFGISYTPFPDNVYAYNFPVKQNNAFNPSVASYGPALLPNGAVATFQSGFPAPAVASIPSNGIVSPADLDQVYEIVHKRFREPYVEAWNFVIQRQLPDNFVLDLAYVGNHGVAQPTNYNINAGLIIGAGNAGRPLFNAYKRIADTNLRYVGTDSHYNGLQVKLDRRFSSGFSMTTAYTFSKGMAYKYDDTGIGSLAYYIDQRRNYSRLDYDRTHTFVQSYIYELPFGKGKTFVNSGPASLILGGWQTNAILTMMTGRPINITYSSAGLNAPGNSQSPNQNGPVKVLHGINSDTWFDTSAFSAPAALTFGNVGRNSLSGPGFFDLDASVFRNFKVRERWEVQLRGESFGVANKPDFDQPSGNFSNTASFGHVKGTVAGSRSFQLALKLIF